MICRNLAATLGCCAAFAAPAYAQIDPEPSTRERAPIIVTAPSFPHAAIGNPVPIRQLDSEALDRFAGLSIGEIVDQIARESGDPIRDESPIELLNGKRVAAGSSITDIPSEAVERVDVLPPSAALAYGLSTRRPVLNFVLKSRYNASNAAGTIRATTPGTSLGGEASLGHFVLAKSNRTSFNTRYEHSDARLARETLIAPSGTRTLSPSRDLIGGTFAIARDLSFAALAIRGGGTWRRSTALLGSDPATLGNPVLNQQSRRHEIFLASTLSRDVGSWTTAISAETRFGDSRRRTGADLPTAIQQVTRFRSRDIELGVEADGPFGTLPGGPATASFRFDHDRSRLNPRNGPADTSSASEARIAISLPITAAHSSGAGRLVTTADVGMLDRSGFSTAYSYGLGAIWTPLASVSAAFSWRQSRTPPSRDQLIAETIETPNVRIFDFTRGVDALVTIRQGGNPTLRPSRSRSWRFNVAAQPGTRFPVGINLGIGNNRLDSQPTILTAATPRLEAAFPSRFVRNAAGQLIVIDQRPINFGKQDRTDATIGLFASALISSGKNAGRLSISVSDAWLLRDRLELGDGLGPISQVGGRSFAPQITQPRHQLSSDLGYMRGPFDLNLSTLLTSATATSSGGGGIQFGAALDAGLQFNANLSKLAPGLGLPKGSRMGLSISGIALMRPSIRGAIDTGGLRDYLDRRTPTVFALSFRTRLGGP
jgi:hypothetical protein